MKNDLAQISVYAVDFPRLQALSEPLIDQTQDVISRIIDFYEAHHHGPTVKPPRSSDADLIFEVGFHPLPSLRHTKLMAAEFNQKAPILTNWNSLFRLALVETFQAVGRDIDELRNVSGAKIVSGTKTDEGYKYHRRGDFSFQGVSADAALNIIIRCARESGFGFHTRFIWRDKDDAAFPGKRGEISFSGK
jgi:hypothetical protein